MFSVNTNLNAMAALEALAATQSALSQTQSEIATGKKVGQASDNPAVYSIAQTMQDTISGLSAVSDNLNFAASVVSVASSAATDISSQLATLQNTVTTGQQSGISSTTIDNQISSILSNIDAFANGATFNGVNITTSAATLTTTKDASGGTISVAGQDITSTGLGLSGLTTASGGLDLSATNTTAFANDDYVKLGNGTNTTYFVLSNGSAAPTAPAATNSTTGVIYVNFNSTDSTATVLSKLASAMQQNGYGASIAGSAEGSINAGDLVVTGSGVTAASSSLSLATAGGATLTSASGADTALVTVTNAISSLNTAISAFGQATKQISGLQSFTTSLSDSLTSGLGALTDANMAAESAQLQSLQTKQSLGIQALAIANQQPQSLLSLFR